jgi:murein DD-endopeptidase MepM/ murein hydrolase activator NlpD
MTASNDRRNHRYSSARWRIVQLLLAIAVLAPGLAMQLSPAPARADSLSDAIAEQQRLAKLIANERAQLSKLTTQQSTLTTQIATTQTNLDGVSSSIDDAEAQMASLEGSLAGVQAHFDSLVAQQTVLQTRLAQLTNEQDAKQRELDVREQILARRLVAAYESDQTPILQQILTAHSLTDALSQAAAYSSLSQADKALADQITADQQTLLQVRQSVEMAQSADADLQAQVGSQRAELDGERAKVVAAKDNLNALQAQLAAQLAADQKNAAKLATNQAALAALIKSNGQAVDKLANKIDKLVKQNKGKSRIPSVYNGKLHWPMSGVITQQFGCTGFYAEPRVGNCAHFHNGIDIMARCYTPIYASGSGVITFVGYNPYDTPPKAWIVIINHSSSLQTWYGHMTAKAIPGIYAGAYVSTGQLIGTENTTGHSTGCHLHWMVRENGVFMNPRLFV